MSVWMILLSVSAPFIFLMGCSTVATQGEPVNARAERAEPTPERAPTKFVVPAEYLNAKPEELCGRLAEIKRLPARDPNDTDPIYEALVAKGDDAVPCLIEKISDATLMKDPREAPVWQNYSVGDTAVFILLRVATKDEDKEWEKLFLTMLPSESQEEWKTNGIYAYFNYVSEPKNRNALQDWWKKWLNNKGAK